LIFKSNCYAAAALALNNGLSFGTVLVNTGGGSGTLSAASVFTSSTLRASGYAAGSVNFQDTILAGIDLLVNFSITPSSVTLSGPSSGVTVSNFTLNPSSYVLALFTAANVNVLSGATLTIPSGVTAGVYTGSVTFQSSGTLAGTNTITLPITVTIGQLINITSVRNMNFGIVQSTPGSQSVILSTAGVITGAAYSVGGTPAAGVFTVTGQPSQNVTITFPSSSFTVTSGANSMTVSALTSSPAAGQSVSLGSTGSFNVSAGGTLGVGANQPAGTYSGSYTIQVNY
jgi:hypothetical protein